MSPGGAAERGVAGAGCDWGCGKIGAGNWVPSPIEHADRNRAPTSQATGVAPARMALIAAFRSVSSVRYRGGRSRWRGVPLGLEEAALESEVFVLPHFRLEVGEDFSGRGGVGVEEVDRGHRQELGRGQIG